MESVREQHEPLWKVLLNRGVREEMLNPDS